MTLDRPWLLATARAERDALGRTVQYTPPEAWDAESPSAGWRTRDIVSHLAAADVAAAAVIGDEEPSELEEFRKSLAGAPFALDEFNRWTVERRADRPVFSVAREWGGVDAYRLTIERRDGAWDVSLKQLGGPPDNRAAARGTGATFNAAWDRFGLDPARRRVRADALPQKRPPTPIGGRGQ